MKNKISFYSILLFFTIISTSKIFAQYATIKGYVYEKETGEAVPFTNVYLKGTSYGSTTDGNGNFILNRILPGTYNLTIKSMGYDSLSQTITLKAGDVIVKKLGLLKSSFNLKEVNITAEKEIARTETRTSVVYVTPKQIKQMPTIGGTPDLAQYLQVLPGVIFTGDQGGQLYIRGGSPIQNKVILDGMVIYNPFHSIGLFSVFDTDILKSADVYTGGFGAEFGGRISSVMDIKTREGNKKRIAGKIDVNTFGSKLLLEGPLIKFNDTTGNSVSWLFSAKNSYLKESSKVLYRYIDTNGLPFNYQDFYGKVSINSSNGSKVNLFGFNFNDAVNYKKIADFKWTSSGGGINIILIPGLSPVIIDLTAAYSQYSISLDDKINKPRTSDINGFNVDLGFNYILGKNSIRYGVEMLGFKTNFNFVNGTGLKISQEENTTEIATYLKYKGIYNKFIVEPGIRFHYFASLSDVSVEPRLALKYNANDNFRFKLASGIYAQNLISSSSDKDVVNLFYGFLSGPENLPEKTFDGTEVKDKLQKAQHIVFGMEWDVINKLTLNLEGYFKNFSQLTNLNKRKIYEDKSPYNNITSSDFVDEYLRKDFVIESGVAKGIDLSMKYELKKLYFWLSYSLGWVNRDDGIIQYVSHFDRRHNVNLMMSYVFGKLDSWQFDVRWNYGSGFAFAQTLGTYPSLDISGNIGSNYTSQNESIGYIYDEKNNGRLPDFHRLDINLKYKYFFTEKNILELNIGATNVYNRPNIFYFDRTTKERVDQLPFMPSIGMNWIF